MRIVEAPITAFAVLLMVGILVAIMAAAVRYPDPSLIHPPCANPSCRCHNLVPSAPEDAAPPQGQGGADNAN